MKGMVVYYDVDKSESRCYRAFSQFVSQRVVKYQFIFICYILTYGAVFCRWTMYFDNENQIYIEWNLILINRDI